MLAFSTAFFAWILHRAADRLCDNKSSHPPRRRPADRPPRCHLVCQADNAAAAAKSGGVGRGGFDEIAILCNDRIKPPTCPPPILTRTPSVASAEKSRVSFQFNDDDCGALLLRRNNYAGRLRAASAKLGVLLAGCMVVDGAYSFHISFCRLLDAS